MRIRSLFPFNTRQAVCGLVCGLTLISAMTSTRADSLWPDDQVRPMFSDRRASAVGDLLTIIVQENSSASKDNNTKTSKQAGLDASLSTFLFPQSGLLTHKGKLPAFKWDSKTDFSGGGTIKNSEKMLAQIAVRVVDVLPNRNLVVEGTRDSAFSGEQQTIVLRGVVRPDDILANNTVFSYNVADSTIKFVSKGTITDNQRKGWLTKVWDKVSPF